MKCLLTWHKSYFFLLSFLISDKSVSFEKSVSFSDDIQGVPKAHSPQHMGKSLSLKITSVWFMARTFLLFCYGCNCLCAYVGLKDFLFFHAPFKLFLYHFHPPWKILSIKRIKEREWRKRLKSSSWRKICTFSPCASINKVLYFYKKKYFL